MFEQVFICFVFFFITVYVLSAWLAEKLSLTDPSQITNCSVTFSLRVTVKLRAASKVSEWPSALRKRDIYSFFFCQSIHRTNSQLHLCVQTRASAAQNSWWMGARRTSVRLWLCQIITCLHGDKTWNSAAWFACVSSRMHNASRAWIIYINKWRESVWCSAKPFLFYFHLKGFFLCVCVCPCVEKKRKT